MLFERENKLNIYTSFLFQTLIEIKLQKTYLLSVIFLSYFQKQFSGCQHLFRIFYILYLQFNSIYL
jgi:hypothetical protein